MLEDFAGNSLDTVIPLAVITNPQVFTDKLDAESQNDYYEIILGDDSSFQFDLNPMKANADVQLIQDANDVFNIGEVLTSSKHTGNNAELINTNINENADEIGIYSQDQAKSKYNLNLEPASDNGKITNNSDTINYKDWLNQSDFNDYYGLSLDSISDLNIPFENLSGNADLRLLNLEDDIFANSANAGNTKGAGSDYTQFPSSNRNEFVDNLYLSPLDAGSTTTSPNSTKLIATSAKNIPLTATSSDSGNTSQNLAPASINEVSTPTALYVRGTLQADIFTYQPGYNVNIFSGNGNIYYGTGTNLLDLSKRDVLDLSNFASNTVNLNLVNSTSGGVLFDLGNGHRLFDAITLADGSQILFEGIDSIKFADGIIDLSVIPNDPLFSYQWNLHMLGVDNAWRFTTGSDQVLIGIEDSGLGFDNNGYIHPDLRATNFINQINIVDELSIVDGKLDPRSHGTLVQGAIAANTNNGFGMAGINWNSPVVHIDVINGYQKNDYDLASATQELINRANGKPLVINLSLAFARLEQIPEQERQQERQRQEQQLAALVPLIANNQDKVLFLIATGNDGLNSISVPAQLARYYDNVVAVGACWANGDRASYSNHGDGLTLMAPAEFFSTDAVLNNSGTFNFDFDPRFGGTSAATPNVAGIASLVWSANLGMTATQIRAILTQNAYDLGTPGYDTTYGYGLVNADAAVRRALALDPNRSFG